MSKRTLVAIAIFAATSGLALANGGTFTPATTAPQNTGNFYVGIAITGDIAHYKAVAGSHHDQDLGGSGWGGELFAGYGKVFMDRYYAGLEVFGDLSSNRAKMSIANNATLDQTWSAGVSFIPGIKVTDSTLLFARLGWINSAFKMANDTIVVNHTRNLNGFEAGLGLEAMMTQTIGIRAEGDLSYYGSKITGPSRTTALDTVVFDRPIVYQFKLGLDYHFNLA